MKLKITGSYSNLVHFNNGFELNSNYFYSFAGEKEITRQQFINCFPQLDALLQNKNMETVAE